MTSPRQYQTATLLASGDLLLTGGNAESCCTAVATAELYTPAAISVKPASGPPGQAVTITGINFFAVEQIQAFFDFGRLPGTPTTSATGGFTLHTKIPASATPGAHSVSVQGRTSFAGASATFTVS